MLSASPLLCSSLWCFSFRPIHNLTMTFCLYLGRIAMRYLTFGMILKLMPVSVLVSFQVMFDFLFYFIFLSVLYYSCDSATGVLNCYVLYYSLLFS